MAGTLGGAWSGLGLSPRCPRAARGVGAEGRRRRRPVLPSSRSKSRAPEDYQVLLGSTRLYQHAPPARTMAVSHIVTHPDFEKSHPFGNDIAMLQLRLPVTFTPYVSPACLPRPGMPLSRRWSCWITGWGMLSEDCEWGAGRRGGVRRGAEGRGGRDSSAPETPAQTPLGLGVLGLVSRELDRSGSSSAKCDIPERQGPLSPRL